MTDNELIAAGWQNVSDAWTHPSDPGIYYSRRSAVAIATRGDAPQSTPAPRPTCGTCPYWRDYDDDDDDRLGECRHNPPADASADGNQLRDWAQSRAHEWCGQHPDMAAWIKTEWPKARAQK